MKKDLWVNNFSGARIGYHLCGPWSGWGITYAQEVFFGKKIITQHFAHMSGVDLIGGYFKQSELRQAIDLCLEKIFTEPELVETNHQEAYKINQEYFEYAEELLKMDLGAKSDTELAAIIDRFIDIHERSHAHSVITTWFVESDGQDLTNKLLGLTDSYVKNSGTKVKTSEAFSLLTTPTKVSLLNQEELESLGVLKLILTDKKAVEIITAVSDFRSIPAGLSPALNQALMHHYEKWCWIPFGYLGPAYQIENYLKIWQAQIKQGLDPEREIKQRENNSREVEIKREALKAELKISPTDEQIFDLTADIIFLKGYRKDCTFHGYYAFDKVLAEVSRRKFLSRNQLQVLTHLEIINLLKSDQKPDLSLVNDRLKRSSIIIHRGDTVEVLSGDKAEAFLNQQAEFMETEVIDQAATEFKGVCACHGQARGIIKIVNTPEEMVKMQAGDVMLSHTTFPSLVPAMKLAAAIITEDGGVTCHAAIVSRELGTPCVTGIKNLTKILKDGDVVEVDADQGIVRIQKS